MHQIQQRIEIAKSCGWVESQNGCWIRGNELIPHASDLPDYLADLNAMHEAEKTLTQAQGTNYGIEINNIMDRDFSKSVAAPHGDCDWHATAAQRAEAFLRIIGRWRDHSEPY